MTPAIDPQARHIIATVALATHAERVVLFGSRARGDARPDSDLDLLVIVPDDVDPRLAGHAGYMALGAHKLAVDLVVLRKSDYERRSAVPWTLAGTVAREGVVVHERAA